MRVHELRDAGADASCGGKAQGLAKLIAAGLPVPPGFVIDDGAFRAIVGELKVGEAAEVGHVLGRAAEAIASAVIPEAFEREVRERARALGPLVAVRSSATIEDGAAGAAAGVFSSRAGVRPDEVWDAIRAVWTSALTPLAAAYARRRGSTIAIGVIVQEYVAGLPLVIYTRPPGAPKGDEVLIQERETVTRVRRDQPNAPHEQAVATALRAEEALGCETGVDVELAGVAIVQARPIVHPTPRVLMPPPPAILAALADGRTWTWDVAHNPDPLSLAQQGLVARVVSAQIAPWSLRVVAGYLYSASNGEPVPPTPTLDELTTRASALEAQLEKIVDVDGAQVLPVTEAIERYLAFYAIWARELSPLIAAAKRAVPHRAQTGAQTEAQTEAQTGAQTEAQTEAQTDALIGARVSAVEATLLGAARGEIDEHEVVRRLSMLSPAWDVSAPTYGERPGVLADAVARARVALERMPAAREVSPRDVSPAIELARAAADFAERDDALFARAQYLVRRALLARAAAIGIPADDIFWLDLEEVAREAPIDPVDARRRAAGARAAAQRAMQWRMPRVVGAESPAEQQRMPRVVGAEAPAAAEDARPALHGEGTGPRVAGRVVRFASLASAVAVGAGDVVVTRAITPALAVLVAGCAALVSETGGLLDHGAALARELGIPCVVGCRDAWSTLADGMLVTVDGDGGTVTTSS